MTTPLLSTKLYYPQSRPNLVLRPRLNERLDAGLQGKLTLVSAPAGFGKTTLVAEWIQDKDKPIAWISLDEGENVLSRFLTYIITAIQQIERDFGTDILVVVQATEHPPLESIMTMFVNQIAEIQSKFILVLDDYHLISTQPIHDIIEFLLDHLPPSMHLVMISRVDPPFSLSRLRVGGQLTEVRSNDLRFSAGEIDAFLNEIMGFDLSEEDISALESRTEGWIASLQLAALSLQGREDKRDFIAEFSGSHHYVIDYLVDEVLSRQPEEIQKFLYRTSVLDRFCAYLCDAVLEIINSKEIIQQLDGSNLFLIPLDDERQWYRYHHLFSDFLKQHLNEREPEIVRPLHRKASHWLEQNSLFPEAINHAIVGEDFQHAAQMIEAIGPDMMMQSKFDQLTAWLEELPQEIVFAWPWLCIIWAWMCQRWAKIDEGEKYLQAAELALENDISSEPVGGEKVIRGQVAAIRALFALVRGNIPQSMDFANQALEYLPENHFNRAVAADALGIAKRVNGDLDGAIKTFETARQDSLKVGNRILAQAIILELGITQAMQGRLTQAADTLREAVQIEYQRTSIKIPYASSASVYLGNILREWGDLDAARAQLEEGIQIGQPAKMVDAVLIGHAFLTRVHLSTGHIDVAVKAIKTAERMARDFPNLESEAKFALLDSKVRLLLAQNQSLEATKLVHETGFDAKDEITIFNLYGHIILARVLLYSGREYHSEKILLDVQSLITRLLDVARPVGRMREFIELLVLRSLVFEALGLLDQAIGSIEEALKLGKPERFVHTFIDEGEPMKSLLQRVKSGGNTSDYVRVLLAKFDLGENEQPATSRALVEHLSERELEVLKLLATELSGPAIADELMVSLNTFRTHTKNIYSKLGVNNRRSAVSKAEELSLF